MEFINLYKKMKVTEHNVTNWNLTEEEINELIAVAREKVKEHKGEIKELVYGIILGKLIIMKND